LDATGFDALGALVLLAAATPAEVARVREATPAAGTTLFFMARQALDPAGFADWAAARQTAGWSKALATARTRLFDQGPARP
jgi:hypothetical protein